VLPRSQFASDVDSGTWAGASRWRGRAALFFAAFFLEAAFFAAFVAGFLTAVAGATLLVDFLADFFAVFFAVFFFAATTFLAFLLFFAIVVPYSAASVSRPRFRLFTFASTGAKNFPV